LSIPEKSSKLLFSVFEKLIHLQQGNYLVSHKPGDTNVVIYEAIKEASEDLSKYYDLHESYKKAPVSSLPPHFVLIVARYLI
jgi:hypothetical protein